MRPIVVKLGGSLLGSGDTSLEDLARLQGQGYPLVAVHGGGRELTRWLERLGLRSQFIDGLRVTDEASLPVVVAVLAGLVNKELVAAINRHGGRAIGLSGIDGNLLEAVREREELGFVGRIVKVHTGPILELLEKGYLPVISPLGVEKETGTPLNINADTAAGEIAAALSAERLIFLSDIPGVLGRDGQPLSTLTPEEAARLKEEGVISSGMIPKLEAGFRALKSGTLCRIINGRQPHTLLQELGGGAPGTSLKEG